MIELRDKPRPIQDEWARALQLFDQARRISFWYGFVWGMLVTILGGIVVTLV